ncbi:F510_1955 family glycosylhydrolase [Bacillus suaedaesalsae]|uniref:Sortilin N-terminal domain-containing protein n=1 Tax=Bacillus suaedaesalsae TaxID=2810349 RepID=A0ABS2DLT4_9BACI|nr:hypothetical protein [Bacillus suaedaesalsae]MBM6619442.1 hypothetical protein [Bacillus suaedaesalsae]
MKKILFVCLMMGLAFVTGCSAGSNEDKEQSVDVKESQELKQQISTESIDFSSLEGFQTLQNDKITHIHGIGYPNSDSGLFIATHHGLKVYSDHLWFETKQNNHDYMGFQATQEGFFSSGHPEQGSDLKNPLGLQFSDDFGQTLEQVNFYGESDFHYMAASYESNQIYVVNEQPNSKIGTGLFFSKDGKDWIQSKLSGLPAVSANNLGVHPNLGHIVGLSTPKGLYLSHDNGDTFSLFSEEVPVYAFVLKENSILYVMENKGKFKLVEQPLESDDLTDRKLPELAGNEVITNVAISPNDEKEISIATNNGSVWISLDNGENWTSIIEAGKITTHHQS